MKHHIFIILALLLPLNSHAENQEKKINVGVGYYVLNVDYDSGFEHDLDGFAIAATYAFSDQFAVRGVFYDLDHTDFPVDATGADLVAYYGTGLATKGFKAYIGGGFFFETWDVSGPEADFSGFQINGGLGYNWDDISFDYIIGIRDPGESEDFNSNIGATVLTGSLMLSVRF